MENYLLHHTHTPQDCERFFKAYRAWRSRAQDQATAFYCTCPSGEHGAVLVVKASSAAQALSLLPSEFRAQARALAAEIIG